MAGTGGRDVLRLFRRFCALLTQRHGGGRSFAAQMALVKTPQALQSAVAALCRGTDVAEAPRVAQRDLLELTWRIIAMQRRVDPSDASRVPTQQLLKTSRLFDHPIAFLERLERLVRERAPVAVSATTAARGRPPAVAGAEGTSAFAAGESVMYARPEGPVRAVVLQVHRDDPSGSYYTIKLPSGREKQTVEDRLAPLTDACPDQGGQSGPSGLPLRLGAALREAAPARSPRRTPWEGPCAPTASICTVR